MAVEYVKSFSWKMNIHFSHSWQIGMHDPLRKTLYQLLYPIKETCSSTQFALYGISNKNVQGLNPLSSFQK